MKSPPMNRRDFLGATTALGALGLLNACGAPLQTAKPPLPPGELSGPNQHLGHRLRRQDFPAPDEVLHIPVLIVGGGVAGLSAAWRLHRAGMTDFMLLEMEAELGGNARAGRNAVSRYPLGAHYLPLPSREAVATRTLLAELGVLLGDPHAAQPVYDEKYLCYAPQERLYIDGYWQEGLWPTVGVAAAERAQYAKFLRHMGELRREIDPRGRRVFASPMALSSRDERWLALDRLDLRAWLLREGYTAPGLHWLADYACRDDYGTFAAETSAWAGLHYFCCRDSDGDDEHAAWQVLTAPEGNAWLTAGLAKNIQPQSRTQALAFRIEEHKHTVVVDAYFPAENRSRRLIAQQLIWAAPLFLLPQVLSTPPSHWLAALHGIDYAPWVVANLTLSAAPPTRIGAPLAWDNVIYGSESLGYVVATHQQLRYAPAPTVLTWYRPLCEESMHRQPSRQRRLSAQGDRRDQRNLWAEAALADLERAHPEIRELVTRIDVHRHAHAMVRPHPGRLWGGQRLAFEHGAKRLHCAHADVSGMSLFEEANDRGVAAAEAALRALGIHATALGDTA